MANDIFRGGKYQRAGGTRRPAQMEDFKKRITEQSYPGKGLTVTKTEVKKKPNAVEVIKKSVGVKSDEPMMTGEMGSVDRTADVIGPNMGQVNRDMGTPVEEMSRQAVTEDVARVARDSDRKSWVDPHEQARRMMGFKKGGAVKKSCGMKKGGAVKSKASSRADGCAQRGKTRGRIV